jgi:DNA-binding NarL/FixJ family response regulator
LGPWAPDESRSLGQRATGDTIARTLVATGQGHALVEGDIFDHLLGAEPSDDETNSFTSRERQVREIAIQGMAVKQIARQLAIFVKTVEKHVGSILRKTGARNRTMLAIMSGRALDPSPVWN